MSWVLAAVAAAILATRSWMLWRTRAQRSWRWWISWAVPLLASLVLLVEIGAVRDALELQKMAGLLVMPAGLVWLGLGTMAAIAVAQGRRKLAWALSALFVLDGCAGNAWLGGALMAGLERGAAPLDIAACQPFDAVVALGGGTNVAPDGRAQVTSAGDRVILAAQIFAAGKSAILVATGSSIPGMERAHDSATEAAEIWRSLGVPAEGIVALVGPHTTSQEIARVKIEAGERGWHRIGLVTSAWHMPRALRLCRRAGLEVTPIPCDFRGRIPPWSVVWLVPCDGGFSDVQRACWEFLGWVMGK